MRAQQHMLLIQRLIQVGLACRSAPAQLVAPNRLQPNNTLNLTQRAVLPSVVHSLTLLSTAT